MVATYVTDLDTLLNALNTGDRWTEIDNQFLVIKDTQVTLYIWVGEVTEADLIAA